MATLQYVRSPHSVPSSAIALGAQQPSPSSAVYIRPATAVAPLQPTPLARPPAFYPASSPGSHSYVSPQLPQTFVSQPAVPASGYFQGARGPAGSTFMTLAAPARAPAPALSSGLANVRAMTSSGATNSVPQSYALESALSWVEQRRACPNDFDESFMSFMMALRGWGFFDGLQTSADGMLRLNIPFCNQFHEAPLLLSFLFDNVLPRCGASGVSIWGGDVKDGSDMWRQMQAYAAHTYGAERVQMDLQQADTSVTPPPPGATLLYGAHPCATHGGPWPAIIEHCLKSCQQGGRCVFTNFYRFEADKTAEMCRTAGFQCEIRENPRYAGMPEPSQYTYFRYLVLVQIR